MTILSGVDIVKNSKMSKLIKRSPFALNDIFSENEIKYCSKKYNPADSYAVRFAAKEALIKAANAKIIAVELPEIEILNSSTGMPEIKLSSKSLLKKIKILLNKEDFNINLSLSHDGDYSIAQVIIY